MFKLNNWKEFNWKKKLLVLFVFLGIGTLLLWVLLVLLFWVIDFKTEKSWSSLEHAFFSTNGLYFFLASLAVCGVGIVFLFVKGHDKLLGRFDKDKKIGEPDIKPKWLSQSDLEKKIIVLKDDVTPAYPTFCIEGVDNVLDKKNKKVPDIAYHILASDRRCLQLQFEKEGKEPKINGGKPINSLVAGATIVCGGARSGKTKQVVKPTIFHLLTGKAKSSMLICDLKGDIFKMTGNLAKENGYNVLRFNTTNAEFSHSWNVLGEIWDLYYNEYLPNWINEHETKTNKQQLKKTSGGSVNYRTKYQTAKSLIEQKLDIIVNTICPLPDKATDPFWYRSAQVLTKLYFLVQLDYGIEKKDYTLFNVCSNAISYQNKLEILKDMLPQWALSKNYASQFKDKAGMKDFSSVQSIAQATLESFTIQSIKDLTSVTDVEDNNSDNSNLEKQVEQKDHKKQQTEINFKKFIEEPTVIYISIDVSTKDSAQNKLAILFMESLYSYLNEYLTKNNLYNGFEKPILFIIDEFGNLPKMNYMIKMFSLDQGKNITPLLVIQSPNQLYSTYDRDQTKELFASAQCVILCSGVDSEFALWFSERSGTSFRQSVSKSINADGKVSKSESLSKMEDIAVGEFTNIIANKEIIICPIGMKPCKIEVIGAEYNKWMNKIQDNSTSSKDVSYGIKPSDEMYYIEDVLDKRIIGLWMNRVLAQENKGNAVKLGLAQEMDNDPFFSQIDRTVIDSEDMNDYYRQTGSYPSLAIKIANRSSALAQKIEEMTKVYNWDKTIVEYESDVSPDFHQMSNAFLTQLNEIQDMSLPVSQRNRARDKFINSRNSNLDRQVATRRTGERRIPDRFSHRSAETLQRKEIEQIKTSPTPAASSLNSKGTNRWKELSFNDKFRISKSALRKDYTNERLIPSYLFNNVIFLCGYVDIQLVKEYFVSESSYDRVMNAVKKSFRGKWLQLVDPNFEGYDSAKKYQSQFKDLINADKRNIDNSPYFFNLIKKIMLTPEAMQGDQFAVVADVFGMANAEEAAKFYNLVAAQTTSNLITE